jgi:hypothetical protein
MPPTSSEGTPEQPEEEYNVLTAMHGVLREDAKKSIING